MAALTLHLRQLTQLDLSHCKLTDLSPGAFLRVDRLERLHLQGRLTILMAMVTTLTTR